MRSDRISSLNAPCKGEVGGRTEADSTQEQFGRYQQLAETEILDFGRLGAPVWQVKGEAKEGKQRTGSAIKGPPSS